MEVFNINILMTLGYILHILMCHLAGQVIS